MSMESEINAGAMNSEEVQDLSALAGMRLGEILVRLGAIHQEQIDEALELQKLRPKRLGEILL
ncbi:MAG TPA: type II secretion system protein GspE, partial [Candidatus Hydrogenedentes bacterium]|nr:type II secretion system protein GspE [Candidatus Hydrogenedentota bacterium]